MRLRVLCLMLFPTHFASAVESKPVSFAKEIAPVLVESCVACHNQKTKKGKYDMSTFDALLKGGGKGAPIIPGKPDESLFSLMMHGQEEPTMPKDADLLPAAVLSKIDLWIKEGAKFDGPSRGSDIRELVSRPKSVATKAYTKPTPTTALAFKPDGKELAAAGYHEITFWNPATGALLRQWPTAAERIHALEYSPDGKLLLEAGGTPGKMGEVVLWDVGAQKPARELLKTDDVIFCATFSPDGKQVAAGGADRLFRIWEVATGKEQHKIENHADWILAIAFSQDGKRILTASRDKSTKIWDQATKEPILTFAQHTDGVYGVAVSSDGKQVWSAGADNQIRAWKPEGDAPQTRATGAHANTIFSLKLAKSGKLLVTSGGDNMVRLWNPADGAQLRALEGQKDWVYATAISPDEKWIAGGAWDGRIKIWESATGKEVVSFQAVPSLALAKAAETKIPKPATK